MRLTQHGWRYLLLATISMAACTFAVYKWRLAHPNRIHPMTVLTKNMHTHCVGRLLIDLPEGATWNADASGVYLNDMEVSVSTGISRQQYLVLVEERWQELQAVTHDEYGETYVKPPVKIGTPEKGIVYAYHFHYVEGPDLEGVWRKDIYSDAEGYFWDGGTLFKIAPKLNRADDIAKLFPRLRARKPDEIPNRPGLCLNGAFVIGDYDMHEREEVAWGFDLPRNMGLMVRHKRVWSKGATYFEREGESRSEVAGYLSGKLQSGETFKEHVFRKAQRDVNGMTGDEVIAGSVEGEKAFGFGTSIGGYWEYPGKGLQAPMPQIEVQLDIPEMKTSYVPSPAGGFPAHHDVPNSPTEAEFFEVWDAIVGSVRVRPIALWQPRPTIDEHPPLISREQAERDRQILDAFIASTPDSPTKPKE